MSDSKHTTWSAGDVDTSRSDAAEATIVINQELKNWIDCVADCYGTSTHTIVKHFLRHGCKNYEDILD